MCVCVCRCVLRRGDLSQLQSDLQVRACLVSVRVVCMRMGESERIALCVCVFVCV